MSRELSRRGLLRRAGGALIGVAAGCATGGSRATVEMTDSLTFEPETLEVAVGETVTWRNVGSAAHSVTAYGAGLPSGADYFASGGFDSESAAREAYPRGAIEAGGTYEHSFPVAGSHAYFCVPHERVGMTGTVAVG